MGGFELNVQYLNNGDVTPKWLFSETGTEFNAEYLLARAAIEGAYHIGLDKSIHHKLIAKPSSPIIFELNEDDRIIEEYPSIYHYFLLAEWE